MLIHQSEMPERDNVFVADFENYIIVALLQIKILLPH